MVEYQSQGRDIQTNLTLSESLHIFVPLSFQLNITPNIYINMVEQEF